ncbi:MAG: short-chain dehydrogenase [Anaerolineaceae bacterium]|nr:short-chain dehydrogenase [Anaerolineaceae bacterium]
MKTLDGKTAIVTGGASGIGRAVLALFLKHGARVALFDQNESAIKETLDNLSEDTDLLAISVDLTDPVLTEKAVQDVVKRFEKVDILVNVAGGSGRRWGDGPLHECSLDGWSKTLDINLTTLFHTTKFVLQNMVSQKEGTIVTVSSVLGLVGGDQDFATHAYAASKGAAISLTRSIASYYAPYGIRANVVCPGLIATPMSERAQNNETIKNRLSTLQPLTADFGQAEDIAEAALYLASPASRFVTGSVLTVDGGWTVR